MKYCSNCGAQVEDNAKICLKCGCLVDSDNSENRNNRCSFLLIYVLAGIILAATIVAFLLPEEDSNAAKKESIVKSEIYSFNKYSIYKNSNAGIYAFNIPLSSFDKNKFIKYAQTLSRSEQGDSSFVFVFNKPVKTNIIDGMLNNSQYNMPLYTTDILWKQSPYFYYSDAFGIKQSYCEINGLNQKYYERNQALLYNETDFSYKYNIQAPKFFGLSSLNGCNPDYTLDDLTIQQEMKLGTIYRLNVQQN